MVTLLQLLFLCFGFMALSFSQFASKGCGQKSPQQPGTSKTYGFTDSVGYNRSYIVYLPKNYNQSSTNGVPMIHALHGYGTSAASMQRNFLMDPNADSNNYIAIYLQATKFTNDHSTVQSWNDGDCGLSPGPEGPTCDPLTVQAVPRPTACDDPDGNECNWCNCLANDIDAVNQLSIIIEDTFCVDMSREYVSGFSQGGMLTHKIGCALSNRFAAVAPYHGQQHIGFNCEAAKGINIGFMNVWGTTDQEVPGQAVLSHDGWYYLPVTTVQQTFAIHNGCDLSNGLQNISTVSDGIDEWKCYGWNKSCNDDTYVLACSHNAGHSIPVSQHENFALPVMWNYFKQFQRIPPASTLQL